MTPRLRSLPAAIHSLRARPGAGLVALAFVLASSFFLAVGLHTPGDVDEGFYAVAAELVGSGRGLYRDFFYPQAPLLPYLLGAFHALLHPSFLLQRAGMALIGGATAAVLAFAVHRETRSHLGAALGVALFCVHELSWQWVPSVRAYSIAGFVGLLAMVLVTSPRRPPPALVCLAAGALAALAPGVRLLLLPVVPAVAVAAALRHRRAPFGRGVALLGLALAAVAVPDPSKAWLAAIAVLGLSVLLVTRRALSTARAGALVLLGAAAVGAMVYAFIYRPAPEAFHFGNVGYHAVRAPGGLIGSWSQNLAFGAAMLGVGSVGDQSAAGLQFALLLALNLAAAFLPGRALRIGPWIATVLIAFANLRPNPLHEHYFAPLVPYLALGAGMTVGHLRGRLAAVRFGRHAALPLALACVYLLAAVPSFGRKWVQGMYGPWDMSLCRPAAVHRGAQLVAAAVRAHPGPILPAWPGSAIGSARNILPGFENEFARNVAYSLDAEQRRAFHVPTHGDFTNAIAARLPSVVVLDRVAEGAARPGLRALLARHGYVPFAPAVGLTEVYVRTASP
jgi:hypothetical protein